MKPTDTTHTPNGSFPTPGYYPLYEYPAYTFDKKYENDEFQKKVITLDSGYHLVLAPPGCGKTDILAERVVRALSCGVSLDDMGQRYALPNTRKTANLRRYESVCRKRTPFLFALPL